MTPGSVFFDKDFHFHDGDDGEKLFVILGCMDSVSVVAKTTSRQNGRGTEYGCQPRDRFENFYLPEKCCALKSCTWVCLDEFYELNWTQLLQKRFGGIINHICNLPENMPLDLQKCALDSMDISVLQRKIISHSLAE